MTLKIKTSISLSPEVVERLPQGKLSTEINNALEKYIRINDIVLRYNSSAQKLSPAQVLTSIETILGLDIKG